MSPLWFFSTAVLFSTVISVGNKNILLKNKMVLHTFDNQKYVIKKITSIVHTEHEALEAGYPHAEAWHDNC